MGVEPLSIIVDGVRQVRQEVYDWESNLASF